MLLYLNGKWVGREGWSRPPSPSSLTSSISTQLTSDLRISQVYLQGILVILALCQLQETLNFSPLHQWQCRDISFALLLFSLSNFFRIFTSVWTDNLSMSMEHMNCLAVTRTGINFPARNIFSHFMLIPPGLCTSICQILFVQKNCEELSVAHLTCLALHAAAVAAASV